MKKLVTAILIVLGSNAYAQDNEQQYKEIVIPKPSHSFAEIGISGGVILSESEAFPFFRAQYITHDKDHLQLAFQLTAASASGLIFGGGIGVNFPLSTKQSYFYPGAAFHYFTDNTLLYGIHIGYNLSISKLLNLNIEPGYYILNPALSTAESSFSIHAGLRFNL